MTSPHTRAPLRVKVGALSLPHTRTRTHTHIAIAESFQDTFCNFNAGNQNYIHFLSTRTSPFSLAVFLFSLSAQPSVFVLYEYIGMEQVTRSGASILVYLSKRAIHHHDRSQSAPTWCSKHLCHMISVALMLLMKSEFSLHEASVALGCSVRSRSSRSHFFRSFVPIARERRQ